MKQKKKMTSSGFLLLITIVLFFVMYAAGMVIFADKGFAKPQMFLNLFVSNAGLLVISCGLTIVMITGGIDISVGSVTALVCMVMADLMENKGASAYVAVAVALGIGLLFGIVQGFLVTYMGIQPFIVTLAGMFFGRGLTAIISTDMIAIKNKVFLSWANYRFYMPFGSTNKKGKFIPAYIDVYKRQDALLEGRKAAEWLNAYATAKEIKPEDLHIVDIQGTIGSTAQIGRTQGLEEGVEKYGWDLLEQQSGEFTQAKGQEVMESMLKKYDNINVVYCENDNEAFGAIDAIEAAGKTVGTDIANGEILVISFDTTNAGLTDTLNGKIACDVECNPLHGPRAEELIKALEAGEEVEKLNYVDEEIFASDEMCIRDRM